MSGNNKQKGRNLDIILTLSALIATFVLWQFTSLPWYLDLIPIWIVVIYFLVTRWSDFREFLRKSIVSLKRNPSIIPLLVLFASFLLYSFNLTAMSDTTAKIQGAGMGLSQFCIMLFSLLSLVCMLNAFPRRKKPNIPMLVIMFLMFAIIVYCNIHYCNGIMAALNRADSPIKLDKSTEYIATAYNMLGTHMVLMGISAALVVLLPVYSKWLKKINTSVDIEDNGAMGEIEINE